MFVYIPCGGVFTTTDIRSALYYSNPPKNTSKNIHDLSVLSYSKSSLQPIYPSSPKSKPANNLKIIISSESMKTTLDILTPLSKHILQLAQFLPTPNSVLQTGPTKNLHSTNCPYHRYIETLADQQDWMTSWSLQRYTKTESSKEISKLLIVHHQYISMFKVGKSGL